MKIRSTREEVWEFRYYETDGKGSRRRRAVTVGTVEQYPSESAARKSDTVQAVLLRVNGEQPHVCAGPPNFGAVIARYETEEMPERYSTSAAYQSYITNYINPRWGETPLTMIKPMAVEHWLKTLERTDGQPLAPKSRSHIRSLMHTIFRSAERWELIDRNPMRLVRVKGGTKRLSPPMVLTPEEFHRVLQFVPNPHTTSVLIAGCLGLRASEILALRWSDFDFTELKLLVQRSVVHGKVDDVKTEYSRDFVPLDTGLVQVLLEYRNRCVQTREGWLFANPVTGRPYHQDPIQQDYIRPAGVSAGVGDGVGWHTFRHSYRAWLDDTGAPLTVQKELMRHASIQTTMNVYGRAMSDTKRKAHSKVVEMILKPKSAPNQTCGDDSAGQITLIGS